MTVCFTLVIALTIEKGDSYYNIVKKDKVNIMSARILPLITTKVQLSYAHTTLEGHSEQRNSCDK